MKNSIKFFAGIIFFLSLIVFGLKISGNGYLIKGIAFTYLKGNNSANIYDGKDFDTRIIEASQNPNVIPYAKRKPNINATTTLKKVLNETIATSFLIIKNDSIVFESYYSGNNDASKTNSFSMAKTITTLLTQIAIQNGQIPSWKTPVKQYLPWLQGKYADKLTLEHLACMESGIDWNEHYTNPFCITAKSYYGSDILKTMKSIPVINEPGVQFNYQSGSTQLLGLALREAVQQPVATYASEKLWKPLGMEASATWHTDHKDGMELTFCCVNAITRDFAKIGLLLLNNGKVNNKTIVDTAFVSNISKPRKTPKYGFAVWIGKTQNNNAFYTLQGIQGQYVTVIPEEKMVVVRTGNKVLPYDDYGLHKCIYTYVDEAVKMAKQ